MLYEPAVSIRLLTNEYFGRRRLEPKVGPSDLSGHALAKGHGLGRRHLVLA